MVRLLRILDGISGTVESSFNPTMVRLLLQILRGYDTKYRSFNPTMVRLLPSKGLQQGRKPTMFQSHNGAIAAELLAKVPSIIPGFNPTMVRLLLAPLWS